jgi:futalosine hydrolase
MGDDKPQKRIALMAALPNEGEVLLSRLRDSRTTTLGDLRIFHGTLADVEALVTFSGLGKINAAAAAAAVLAGFSVSRLWMWGSGGAYRRAGVDLDDLALASEEILADEGVATITGWEPLDAIGIPAVKTRLGPIFNRLPVDSVELERARLLLSKWQPIPSASRVHIGPFLTVSGVSGSAARARLLVKRHAGLCENMEGGAVAQICLKYQVPFLEIRGLSNWAGDRNKKRWQLEKALDNCQRAVLYLLKNWHTV